MPNDSDYVGMYMRLFDDLEACYPAYSHKEAIADFTYALKRVRDEGIAFLVKTLPSLGKALDASFASGTFEPHPAFSRDGSRTTPKFLRVLFKAVFDDGGRLRDNPDPVAVGHLRQACFMFYKLEHKIDPELEQDAINAFVQVDQDLKEIDLGRPELRPIIIRAKQIIERVFKDFDPMDIVPRPGPGASASGTPKWLRYEMLTKYDQVHQVYPVYDYFYVNREHLKDRISEYWKAPRSAAPISKLRLVPKDSRGPRIICMEEQEVMFLQQGLADKMRARIESHPITKGRVNFTCQEVNRQLAKRASCIEESSFSKATLDMKEASDRVSRELVATLFGGLPLVLRALLSLSTRAIQLPCGDVLQTLKYAPMGSSLCFPVMSIVHFSLGRAIIELHASRSNKALADVLHVYGDDIIVDTEYVDRFFEIFPLFGLKFNQGKSFVGGPFRESCGFDAFLGRNVSPQRVKKRFFESTTPRHLIAALDIEYNLHTCGYKSMAQYLRYLLLHRLGEEIPFVGVGSPVVGWRRNHPAEIDFTNLRSKYDPKTQTRYVRARVIKTAPTVSMRGEWEQLMRVLTGTHRGSKKLSDPRDEQSIAWSWVPIQAMTHTNPVIRGLEC